MEFLDIYAEALATLRAAFPGRVLVELKDAAPAVGIGHSTWHHLAAAGRAPFRAVRIGNRRLAAIPDLAEFVARRLTGGDEPKTVGRNISRGPSSVPRGRPTKAEERRAAELGISVREFRRQLRADAAMGEEQ